MLTSCAAPRGATTSTDEGDEVVLTFATAFDSNHSNNAGFWLFKERLEKAPWIEIDYRGGPEVMAPNLLIEGVSSGAFDGASLPGDYYVDQLPAMEIPPVHTVHPDGGARQRYCGALRRDPPGTAGRPLSRPHGFQHPQVILLQEPLDSADLSGRAVRTSSATSGVVQAMGGIPVDLSGGEVYTAMERGVVDGASWASVGPSSLGLHDVVSYDLVPRFFESLANLVINDDTWESLDAPTSWSWPSWRRFPARDVPAGTHGVNLATQQASGLSTLREPALSRPVSGLGQGRLATAGGATAGAPGPPYRAAG